jgi:hypothetical protein
MPGPVFCRYGPARIRGLLDGRKRPHPISRQNYKGPVRYTGPVTHALTQRGATNCLQRRERMMTRRIIMKRTNQILPWRREGNGSGEIWRRRGGSTQQPEAEERRTNASERPVLSWTEWRQKETHKRAHQSTGSGSVCKTKQTNRHRRTTARPIRHTTNGPRNFFPCLFYNQYKVVYGTKYISNFNYYKIMKSKKTSKSLRSLNFFFFQSCTSSIFKYKIF